MDAIKFFKVRDRMCKKYRNCRCCPAFKSYKNGCVLYAAFNSELINDFKTAISLMEQWDKENPEKTRLQDFVERNPNAPLTEAGYPMMYPKHMGYCKTMDCTECEHFRKNQLTECWDLPLEE